MNILLMIFPIALIAVLLYKSGVCRVNEYNDDYLSLSQTKLIQAVAAVGVILHHVTQIVTEYGNRSMGPITAFAQMGIMFTAIFFFCSGYGLLISYKTRENYLDGFLLYRLAAVLIPFFAANLVYIIYTCIDSGRIIESGKILRYLFGIYLINSNGWYIIEILVLYLAFYILFRIVGKLLGRDDAALVLLCIFTVLLIVWTKGRGHENPAKGDVTNWFMGEWWYNSTSVFIMGLLFARFKEQITRWLKNHYKAVLIVTVILLPLTYMAEEVIRIRYGYYRQSDRLSWISDETLTCIVQNFLCIVSTFFVIVCSLKIRLGNKCLKFLSYVSTELFLCHGMFVTLFTEVLKIKNIFFQYVLVILCSLPLAYLLARGDKFLVGKIAKIKIPKFTLGRSQKLWLAEKTAVFKKKGVAILLGIIVGGIVIFDIIKTTVRYITYKREVAEISGSSVGDIVTFGRFDIDEGFGKEPLEWIVLKENGGKYLMVTKYGIAGSAYNIVHRETSWKNSDLRKKLTASRFTDMFSDREKNLVVTNECGDMISLLSVDEARELFESDDARVVSASFEAKAEGVNVNDRSKVNYWDYKDDKSSWWWLRGDDTASLTAPIVNVDGQIVTGEKYVNKPGGAVRPVIIVEIK